MIDFGEWLTENEKSLSIDVYGLFNDSYRCLKNDIDRPAYLLAYQGMMQHVRETVLHSLSKPTGFTDAEWESRWLSLLRNDEKWDETAFKCTQQLENVAAGKAAIMKIRQEVREKFVFWRQLRNVSAHYKGYDLHKAHALALYSFIEQYLLTLSVEGGQVALNSQFDDFFNPLLTSRHAEIKPLLGKIDSTIRDDEFDTFFIEVRKSCANYSTYGFDTRFHEFIHNVLSDCPLRVKNAVVNYIKSDERLFLDYLDDYPRDVLVVLSGVDNIHKFWYSKLPTMRRMMIVLPLMLSADLIPAVDKKDAMLKCLKSAEENSSSSFYNGLSEEMKNVLASNGYFDIFYDEFFNPQHTKRYKKEICYQTDFYIGTISLIPWDKKYVESLISVFSESVYPYTLQDRLQKMYREDAEYKAIIDKICSDEGLTLPTIIT